MRSPLTKLADPVDAVDGAPPAKAPLDIKASMINEIVKIFFIFVASNFQVGMNCLFLLGGVGIPCQHNSIVVKKLSTADLSLVNRFSKSAGKMTLFEVR